MEPATLGFGCDDSDRGWVCRGSGSGFDVGAVCLLLGVSGRALLAESTLGLAFDACGLLLLLLLPGVALRLRPRRYSSAGFKKIPAVAPAMSVPIPIREEAVPVTGSQRRFSIKIGFERYL